MQINRLFGNNALTKRMAEELSAYLARLNIRTRYIHSDIDTLERVEIMDGLRKGTFDVLVGINLLREGLDLPEVSLVAILDADKEGFLRSERSLTQTAGRAARHISGKVIMYADQVTDSMQKTMDETRRKREKQLRYNREMGITPRQIVKTGDTIMAGIQLKTGQKVYAGEENRVNIAADPVVRYMDRKALEKAIEKTRKAMEEASAKLDFIEAARYRDELTELEKLTRIPQ